MKTIKQRISYAVMGLMAMGFTACNHGKTKSARIQKRNVFSTDKNEM